MCNKYNNWYTYREVFISSNNFFDIFFNNNKTFKKFAYWVIKQLLAYRQFHL